MISSRLNNAILVAALGGAMVSPADASTINVFTLGDSLAYGFTGVDPVDGKRFSDSGWRKHFYPDLLDAGLTVDMLGNQNDSDDPGEGGVATVITSGGVVAFDGDHNGHSGWRIDTTAQVNVPRGLQKLDDRTGSSHQGMLENVQAGEFDPEIGQADYLILAVGSNDTRRGIVNDFSAGTMIGDQAGHEDLGGRLDNLIDEIMHADHGFTGTMLVSNIPPVKTGFDPFGGYDRFQGSFSGDLVNDAVDIANLQIQQLFDAQGNHLIYGSQVQLLDVHSQVDRDNHLLSTSSANLVDGLHYNAAGNEVVGAFYADAVLANIPEPGSLALLAIGGAMLVDRRRRRA